MRTFFTSLLLTCLLAPSAQAAPLPDGKPAGIHSAALEVNEKVILITVGMAVVMGALGFAWGSNGSSSGTSK